MKAKTNRIELLAGEIRGRIGAGTNQLKCLSLRADVAGALQGTDDESLLLALPEQPMKFMEEVVMIYIAALPGPPPRSFRDLEQVLQPLKDIALLLDPQTLGEWVQIAEEKPCRMRDGRIPLLDFKIKLAKQLFPKIPRGGKD